MSSAHCLNKAVEAELRSLPGNNICCDCDGKNPQWASVSFGIFMCLECSGRHRALGVHISFVRSVSMDSWTEKQINSMRAGGNDKFNQFIDQYGVKKTLPIAQKYNTPAVLLYKDRLLASIEGRELPTQLPTVSSTTTSGGSAIAEGSEPLPGETTEEYVARQRLLQERARERLRAKGLSSSGKMGGIGSDPSYDPSKQAVPDVSDIASGALSFLSSSVKTVSEYSSKVGESVKSGDSWSYLKSGASDLWSKASSVVADVVGPQQSDETNIFGITREQIKTSQAGSNTGNIGGASVAAPSRYTPSPTLRGNSPSPGPANEDVAALQAIKNINLDGPMSRNSSKNTLSRSSSSGSVGAHKVPTALAPAGDDFFASFGAK